MYDRFVFSDNQTFTNLSSTGAISTNVWDMEDYASGSSINQTDIQLKGYLVVIITSVSYTSGGTEGITFRLLHDTAAAALTTTRATSGAGFYVGAQRGIPYTEIVAGRAFAIPVLVENPGQYVGFWPVATSTTYTGTLKFDAYFTSEPETNVLEQTQKRRNTTFG